MNAREDFAALLADFTAASGLRPVETNPGGDGVAAPPSPKPAENAVFEIGEVVVNLQLLAESEAVLAWATLGFLGADANAPERLVFLMRANDYGSELGGFSFALDEDDDNRVLVQDIRPLSFFDCADRLAAWVETLVEIVGRARLHISATYPLVDDEPLEVPSPDFKEVR